MLMKRVLSCFILSAFLLCSSGVANARSTLNEVKALNNMHNSIIEEALIKSGYSPSDAILFEKVPINDFGEYVLMRTIEESPNCYKAEVIASHIIDDKGEMRNTFGYAQELVLERREYTYAPVDYYGVVATIWCTFDRDSKDSYTNIRPTLMEVELHSVPSTGISYFSARYECVGDQYSYPDYTLQTLNAAFVAPLYIHSPQPGFYPTTNHMSYNRIMRLVSQYHGHGLFVDYEFMYMASDGTMKAFYKTVPIVTP